MADNFCVCNSITGIKYHGHVQDIFTFTVDGLITIELLLSFKKNPWSFSEVGLPFFWSTVIGVKCERGGQCLASWLNTAI